MARKRHKSKPSKAPNIVLEVIEGARQKRGDVREKPSERCVGITHFARDMGVSVQAVQRWIARNEIPSERVIRAEELSDVPRQRIRADLYPPERITSVSSPAHVAP